MSHNAVFQHLHQLKAKDLVADKKLNVVSFKSTDSVEKAVKTFSENKILSAPVFDAKSNELVGFVDVLDVVKFITTAAPSPQAIQADELKSLTIAGRAIGLAAVEQLMNKSGKDALITCFQDSPASALVDIFATGVHRVGLTDDTGALVNICSQTDVARYLNQKIHMGEMKVLGEKKICDLGYASAAMFTVSQDDTVLYALSTMVNNGVGAVAVVNADGRLVGNFSASNMRGLYYDKFPHLLDTVFDFLTERSPLSLEPVVGVSTSSLTQIISEITNSKLHHLWIVDEFKPVGIISLTDVMKVIKNSPQP